MKKTSETVVFFGSGPVAAESLRLLQQDFTIEAVVTKPRLTHHKGDVPVLDVAEQYNLPIYTVSDKQELKKLFLDRPATSKLAILIDFGIIVPQMVIDYFPLGIINSHFSLLPQWRGADPITFSILSGQEQTGVSLMLLVAAMDEGPLLGQGTYDLDEETTTPELTGDLVELSYHLLREIVPGYIEGSIVEYPQDPAVEATYSRKLSKDDAVIDWHKPAAQIEREVRAFIEWPKSKTAVGNLDIVITKAHAEPQTGTPGERIIFEKKPAIYTGEGLLVLDKLKPAGKKEMTGEAFLAGYKQQFLA
jgi:methionyl-tRNA formyltransferase